ncbi:MULTISPECIES: hypothetical protein [Acidithiobacillus]|uniref:hypothetical protein n=1 Tax=Acidithiobacillus TaxID=119977 RepID=UPI0004E126CB|nr:MULTISPECIES: hypothetical protein [Acidithiobacillus]MDD5278614.1 hypothetical protein [Acidithiobacillus sp.]
MKTDFTEELTAILALSGDIADVIRKYNDYHSVHAVNAKSQTFDATSAVPDIMLLSKMIINLGDIGKSIQDNNAKRLDFECHYLIDVIEAYQKDNATIPQAGKRTFDFWSTEIDLESLIPHLQSILDKIATEKPEKNMKSA